MLVLSGFLTSWKETQEECYQQLPHFYRPNWSVTWRRIICGEAAVQPFRNSFHCLWQWSFSTKRRIKRRLEEKQC